MRTIILFVCMIVMGITFNASAQNYKDSINGKWMIEGLKLDNNDTIISLAIEDTFCVKLKPVFKASIMESEEVTEEQFDMVWQMTCGMLYGVFSKLQLDVTGERFELKADVPGSNGESEKGTIKPSGEGASSFILKNDTKPGDQTLTFNNGRLYLNTGDKGQDNTPAFKIVLKKK